MPPFDPRGPSLFLLLLLAGAGPTRAQSPVERRLEAPVPKGSVWKYLDSGKDPGAGWFLPSFSDARWKSGPAELGYGDGDERTVLSYGGNPWNKHITTWFRRSFKISTGRLRSASIRLLADDGALVRLNGVEIARFNLPAGTITASTLARKALGGADEKRFHTFGFDPKLLKKGMNLLAVEVHQASAASSDLSFDLALEAGPRPPRVVRGPYLQSAAPTAITICWRTAGPSDAGVWLGPTPSSLKLVRTATTPAKDHAVRLTGLSPDTTYFYAVGTSRLPLAGGGTGFRFKTPPGPSSTKPIRIWVLGDCGTGNATARAVRDAFEGFHGAKDADLWLLLGDNAYYTGRDDEYQDKFFAVYPEQCRRLPLWPALGNHDGYSANSAKQSGPYYDIFSLPSKGESGGVPSGTESYYSFDHGPIHFVCLNSFDEARSRNGAMLKWLARDLAAAKARWLIAFWHHPPYSKGSHDSDRETNLIDMRREALPLLEAHGVDLVLGGHSHSYERSMLLDGHYGPSTTLAASNLLDRGDGRADGDGIYAKATAGLAPREGTVYVVAGSSGWVGGGRLDHPAMAVSLRVPGSLVLDVRGDRLEGSFLDAGGRIRDRFTIRKGLDRSLRRIEPRISLSRGGVQHCLLKAGAARAGKPFMLLSALGASRGQRFRGLFFPLDPDPWFQAHFTLLLGRWRNGKLPVLDAAGKATDAFPLPPLRDPRLLGFALHRAFLVLDSKGPVFASNAVKLTLDR